MKTILMVLLLTISAFAATTVVHDSGAAFSLDGAVDEAISGMHSTCKDEYQGDISNAVVVAISTDKQPTYTLYTVEMTATCTTK